MFNFLYNRKIDYDNIEKRSICDNIMLQYTYNISYEICFSKISNIILCYKSFISYPKNYENKIIAGIISSPDLTMSLFKNYFIEKIELELTNVIIHCKKAAKTSRNISGEYFTLKLIEVANKGCLDAFDYINKKYWIIFD